MPKFATIRFCRRRQLTSRVGDCGHTFCRNAVRINIFRRQEVAAAVIIVQFVCRTVSIFLSIACVRWLWIPVALMHVNNNNYYYYKTQPPTSPTT